MKSEKFAAAIKILMLIAEADVAVGGELEGEDGSTIVAEVAATEVTVRGGLFLLGLEGLAGEEVA